jgi:hypothetical protein
MGISTLDAFMATYILLSVTILLRVPVSIGLVTVPATGLVEKERERQGDTKTDISSCSWTY